MLPLVFCSKQSEHKRKFILESGLRLDVQTNNVLFFASSVVCIKSTKIIFTIWRWFRIQTTHYFLGRKPKKKAFQNIIHLTFSKVGPENRMD
jgi:hypothetical protein